MPNKETFPIFSGIMKIYFYFIFRKYLARNLFVVGWWIDRVHFRSMEYCRLHGKHVLPCLDLPSRHCLVHRSGMLSKYQKTLQMGSVVMDIELRIFSQLDMPHKGYDSYFDFALNSMTTFSI